MLAQVSPDFAQKHGQTSGLQIALQAGLSAFVHGQASLACFCCCPVVEGPLNPKPQGFVSTPKPSAGSQPNRIFSPAVDPVGHCRLAPSSSTQRPFRVVMGGCNFLGSNRVVLAKLSADGATAWKDWDSFLGNAVSLFLWCNRIPTENSENYRLF